MGSLLLPAKDKDEGVKKERPIAPPQASPTHPHAGLPPSTHEHGRPHETVINGTTWYLPPPPHHLVGSFDYPPIHPSSRYATLPPFDNLGLDPRPRPYRHRHNTVHDSSSWKPPYYLGHASIRAPPSSPYFDAGGASGFMPSQPFYDNASYNGMRYRNGFEASPGFAYGRPNGLHPFSPNHHFTRPYEMVPCYPYDGSFRPYIPNQGSAPGAMPNPWRPQSPMPRGYGSMPRAQISNAASYSYGMPPHAIQDLGKTFRQIVTWCGMTMPVTVTSQAAAVVDWIQRQSGEIFGFDVEWKPNRLRGEENLVALLQICGPSDCLIVQLLYTDMIPRMLKEFLLDSRKQLGGVGILQDVSKLERDHDLTCQGQVELGMLASEKLQRVDLQGKGLKSLVDQVLGMTLVKVKKITMSNWEKECLDEKQIEYACIDAWAAFALLQKLTAL